MDVATISAIAVLFVAVFALMVAFAQAIQKYFITGQGISLCDSVVFADMPGQGRRIWQASQFRFRVVYSIPQISLPNRFWPPNWSVSYMEGRHSLPNLSGFGEYTVVWVVQPDFPYVQRLREREIVYEEVVDYAPTHSRAADDSSSSAVIRRGSGTYSPSVSYREPWLERMRFWVSHIKFRIRSWRR
jgi:hypothetical protein